MGGTTRQSLDTESTAAGEQVQAAGTADIGLQPVEQGFAYAVGRGAQAAPGNEIQAPAAMPAADDAHLVSRHLVPHRPA